VYECFDHTADIGLRVRAPDLPALLAEAAAGLFAVIVEPAAEPAAAPRRAFAIRGERPDWLLFDWLSELLYVFDTERLVLGRFAVRAVPGGIEASAAARPLDPARDRVLHEVKAVTYHGLRAEAEGGGWVAEVILDI